MLSWLVLKYLRKKRKKENNIKRQKREMTKFSKVLIKMLTGTGEGGYNNSKCLSPNG